MATFRLIPHRYCPRAEPAGLTSLKSTDFDSPANSVGRLALYLSGLRDAAPLSRGIFADSSRVTFPHFTRHVVPHCGLTIASIIASIEPNRSWSFDEILTTQLERKAVEVFSQDALAGSVGVPLQSAFF